MVQCILMTIRAEALDEFKTWLPGELVYSVTKTSYDEKINRAARPIEDPRSIYGFLGSEWFTHQDRKQKGAHHVPFHGKSAQLQLTKFAAGLFDKVGVGLWLSSGDEASEATFVGSAADAVVLVLDVEPWQDNQTPLNFLDAPFDETPFATGIQTIMHNIVEAQGADTNTERRRLCREFIQSSLELGGLATRCYQAYAETYLQPHQLILPQSELS